MSFGITPDSGGLLFNVADASNVVVPEGWMFTYTASGFTVDYIGLLPIFPVGYLPFEVSFDSLLLPSDVDSTNPYSGPLSGAVFGTVILDDSQESSWQQNGDSSYTSAIVGYQSFYYNEPLPESQQITYDDLIALGFTPKDLVPVVADTNIDGNYFCIEIKNLITDLVYHLQYRPSLETGNWVVIDQFTSDDLDDNGCISIEKSAPTGYFQISVSE